MQTIYEYIDQDGDYNTLNGEYFTTSVEILCEIAKTHPNKINQLIAYVVIQTIFKRSMNLHRKIASLEQDVLTTSIVYKIPIKNKQLFFSKMLANNINTSVLTLYHNSTDCFFIFPTYNDLIKGKKLVQNYGS